MSAVRTGPERGEGGGRVGVDPRMEFGVESGLGGGEACSLRLVRREAKNAATRGMIVSLGYHHDVLWDHHAGIDRSIEIYISGINEHHVGRGQHRLRHRHRHRHSREAETGVMPFTGAEWKDFPRLASCMPFTDAEGGWSYRQ